MTTVDEIRARIRRVRKEKQMTAAQVAEGMGISRPFYTQLEGGTRRLGTDYLLRIAEALRVPVTDLILDTPAAPTPGGAVVDRFGLERRLEPIVGEKAREATQAVVEFLGR